VSEHHVWIGDTEVSVGQLRSAIAALKRTAYSLDVTSKDEFARPSVRAMCKVESDYIKPVITAMEKVLTQ
jgi:hypothetical protein